MEGIILTDAIREKIKICENRFAAVRRYIMGMIPDHAVLEIGMHNMGYISNGVWTLIGPTSIMNIANLYEDEEGVHWLWNNELDGDLLIRLKETLYENFGFGDTFVLHNRVDIDILVDIICYETDADYFLNDELLGLIVGRFSDVAHRNMFRQ